MCGGSRPPPASCSTNSAIRVGRHQSRVPSFNVLRRYARPSLASSRRGAARCPVPGPAWRPERRNALVRIAFYSPRQTHLEPALAHGGDPIFLQHLLAALARRGHDVRIISRLDVRNVWRGRTKRRRVVAEALRITRDMKRFRPHAWLAYDVSPTSPDLFGWWQQMPRYVLLSPHTWQSKRLSGWWRRGFAMAYRRSLARADAVLVSGPASAERLRAYSVPQERLRILPPAVPVPEAIPERAE